MTSPTPEEIARALGGKKKGSYWLCRCPAHEDTRESLSITVGDTGVPLFKCFTGCSSEAIVDALRARQLWNGRDLEPHRGNGAAPATPARSRAAAKPLHTRTLDHPTHGKPLYTHEYRDSAGELRFVVCRWEPAGQPKIIRPAAPHPAGGWDWTGPNLDTALASPRPPYRLQAAIAETDCHILIVEGEKKADIAAKLFLEWVVVAWSGGAAGADYTGWDWIPPARRVAVWPDNDESGIKAAHKIARRIPDCAVVDVTRLGLPEKWDLGDPLPADLDPEAAANSARAPEPAEPAAEPGPNPDLEPPPWDQPGETGPRELTSRALFVGELRRQPRPEYLIKGVIDRACFAEIFGPYGVGKSFLAIDIAVHLALGLPWRGRRTRQCGVLYVCGEGSMLNRLDAWEKHHSEPLENAPILSVIAPVNLLRTEGVDQLIADCARVPDLGAIFIDTAARATPGSDEGPEAMSILVAACDRIRTTTGAALILVHHAGKDTSRGSRGSTVLPAAVDSMIEVSQDPAGHRTATIAKAREGETGATFPFELPVVILSTDQDGDDLKSCVAIPAPDSAPKAKKPTLGKNLELALLILQDSMPNGLTQNDWNDRMAEAGITVKQRWAEVRLKLKAKSLAHEYNDRWYARQPNLPNT